MNCNFIFIFFLISSFFFVDFFSYKFIKGGANLLTSPIFNLNHSDISRNCLAPESRNRDQANTWFSTHFLLLFKYIVMKNNFQKKCNERSISFWIKNRINWLIITEPCSYTIEIRIEPLLTEVRRFYFS